MVLPLLALTWMSAVLAVTDRRSALFQILFAVFDSLEGFVIVMVHCILRREVGRQAGGQGVPFLPGPRSGPGAALPSSLGMSSQPGTGHWETTSPRPEGSGRRQEVGEGQLPGP